MPKISSAGASDVSVDENFIAPPGVAPQDAIDLGLPDVGQPQESDAGQPQEQEGSTDDAADRGESARDRGDGPRPEARADGNGDVSAADELGAKRARGRTGANKR